MNSMAYLRTLLLALAALFIMNPAAHADIEIDITRGHLNPMPIAVPDFIGVSPQEQQVGRDVAKVIRDNLTRSSLFRSIPGAAFPEQFGDVNANPRFLDWRPTTAQTLVVGQSTVLPDGRLRIEFRLWDVFGESQALGLQYATTQENWRRIAHKISDAIYERLTGEKGYFDTRVVFVSETGPKARRNKRLMIMDQDGANQVTLETGVSGAITPRFSPSNQQITFMSFETLRPRVFIYNLDTNRREVLSLGDIGSMSYAPRFSPDGNSVAMTVDINGNSEIYVMDLRTRQMRRLTNSPAIDVSPSFSPDGEEIVFNSNRGGSPALYIMDKNGGNVRRISGGGRYTTPVWSPRGDLIAFTKQTEGRFAIGVMRTDGTQERLLTSSYLDEGPTWSPNGRVILFFREARPGAGPRLWSVDLTGQNERQVETSTDASDPAWSPLLP
jgi:TolB protein